MEYLVGSTSEFKGFVDIDANNTNNKKSFSLYFYLHNLALDFFIPFDLEKIKLKTHSLDARGFHQQIKQ